MERKKAKLRKRERKRERKSMIFGVAVTYIFEERGAKTIFLLFLEKDI